MQQFVWRTRAPLVALVLVGCWTGERPDALEFPGGNGGKTDILGRGLVGIANDYPADNLNADELASNMQRRRAVAWATVEKVLEPVPLLGLPGASKADEINEEIPNVARWQTWYGIDDLKRIFQALYVGLEPSDRAVRADFSRQAIAAAEKQNAHAIERSTQWPLERYLHFVRSLGVCPSSISDDECARVVAAKTAGAASGNARILYSPKVAQHVVGNYRRTLECLSELDSIGVGDRAPSDENFTACFDSEVPTAGVLIKAQWSRADFGRKVPAFDTDGDSMRRRLDGTATWGETGDRLLDPDPSQIFTIRLRNGNTYRLVGLHIMTKELRHWQWISLWWSDTPSTDFGADRPETVGDRLASVWSNYKMCVVDSYTEHDGDPSGRFSDLPSLAGAIAATSSAGGPTWCSNPYMERGRNNARTNCIGCHQHGGASKAFGASLDVEWMLADELKFPDATRREIRQQFPSDYMFSFNRVDDYAHMIEAEVGFHDSSDAGGVAARVSAIEELGGDASFGSGELLGPLRRLPRS